MGVRLKLLVKENAIWFQVIQQEDLLRQIFIRGVKMLVWSWPLQGIKPKKILENIYVLRRRKWLKWQENILIKSQS